MPLLFQWDKNKAAANIRKHNVSFDEATSVFRDPSGCIFDDEWHSSEEEREIIIGFSISNRLVLVCFTERDGTIRIISARRATKKERREYEEYASFRDS